jgi:hypothetical protein
MYVMWILHYAELQDFEFTVNGPYLKGIYFEQFLFLSLHIAIRCFIIAVRYGSCSDLRFSLLQTDSQTADFVSKDYLARGWLFFDPNAGLLSEINSSLWRNEVEDCSEFFRYNVMERLTEDNRERLIDPQYYKRVPYSAEGRKKEIHTC